MVGRVGVVLRVGRGALTVTLVNGARPAERRGVRQYSFSNIEVIARKASIGRSIRQWGRGRLTSQWGHRGTFEIVAVRLDPADKPADLVGCNGVDAEQANS